VSHRRCRASAPPVAAATDTRAADVGAPTRRVALGWPQSSPGEGAWGGRCRSNQSLRPHRRPSPARPILISGIANYSTFGQVSGSAGCSRAELDALLALRTPNSRPSTRGIGACNAALGLIRGTIEPWGTILVDQLRCTGALSVLGAISGTLVEFSPLLGSCRC